MKRGAIHWINLEPSNPPEFGKLRPGIIVSNTEQNNRLPTVVMIPLSTKSPEIWPLRLQLQLPSLKSSFAVIPGIRQVNKTRIQNLLGIAPADFMQRLDEALNLYLI